MLKIFSESEILIFGFKNISILENNYLKTKYYNKKKKHDHLEYQDEL